VQVDEDEGAADGRVDGVTDAVEFEDGSVEHVLGELLEFGVEGETHVASGFRLASERGHLPDDIAADVLDAGEHAPCPAQPFLVAGLDARAADQIVLEEPLHLVTVEREAVAAVAELLPTHRGEVADDVRGEVALGVDAVEPSTHGQERLRPTVPDAPGQVLFARLDAGDLVPGETAEEALRLAAEVFEVGLLPPRGTPEGEGFEVRFHLVDRGGHVDGGTGDELRQSIEPCVGGVERRQSPQVDAEVVLVFVTRQTDAVAVEDVPALDRSSKRGEGVAVGDLALGELTVVFALEHLEVGELRHDDEHDGGDDDPQDDETAVKHRSGTSPFSVQTSKDQRDRRQQHQRDDDGVDEIERRRP